MKKIIGTLAQNKKLVVALVTALVGFAGVNFLPKEAIEPVVTIGLEVAQAFSE